MHIHGDALKNSVQLDLYSIVIKINHFQPNEYYR